MTIAKLSLMFTSLYLIKQYVLKKRVEMWAAETMPISNEKAQVVFWGGLIPGIPAMPGYTFSYLLLQVISFNMHLRGGKKNTHKKSILEHSRLPPSKTEWSNYSYSRMILRFRKNNSIASLLADTATVDMPESDSPKWCFPGGVLILPPWLPYPPHTSQYSYKCNLI